MQLPKTSEIDRLAWGTDAGFYRLLPNMLSIRTTNRKLSKFWTTHVKTSNPLLSALPEQVFRDKPLPTPF